MKYYAFNQSVRKYVVERELKTPLPSGVRTALTITGWCTLFIASFPGLSNDGATLVFQTGGPGTMK